MAVHPVTHTAPVAPKTQAAPKPQTAHTETKPPQTTHTSGSTGKVVNKTA